MTYTYLIPLVYGYDRRAPFWEVVFCYGCSGISFNLDHNEFKIGKAYFLDKDTFRKYINEAMENGVIHPDQNGEETYYKVSDTPLPHDSVEKPQDFILNSWHLRFIRLGPIGLRSLWLLNFLIRKRNEDLGECTFKELIMSLRTSQFNYEITDLKRNFSQARGASTEEPQSCLQLLYKLGLIMPASPDSFIFPEKGQSWEFTLNLDLLEREAFARLDQKSVLFIPLNILCRYLSRCRRQLIETSLNPNKTPVSINLDGLVNNIIQKIGLSNLKIPPHIKIEDLIRDFWQILIGEGIVRQVEEGKFLLCSAVVDNWEYQVRPLAAPIISKYLTEARARQINEAMFPIMECRDRRLGNLVIKIGEAVGMMPEHCIIFYTYLQAHLVKFPSFEEDEFIQYCITEAAPLLQLGEGYGYILETCLNREGQKPSPKITDNIKKKFEMNDVIKEASIVLSGLKKPKIVRLRRILRLKSDLPPRMEQQPLRIELLRGDDKPIYTEDIPLLNLRWEELPPTADLSKIFGSNISDIKLRVSTPEPLPQLNVHVILEISV